MKVRLFIASSFLLLSLWLGLAYMHQSSAPEAPTTSQPSNLASDVTPR